MTYETFIVFIMNIIDENNMRIKEWSNTFPTPHHRCMAHPYLKYPF